MKPALLVVAFLTLLATAACSRLDCREYCEPRFTHIDMGEGPMPFVFFDQKTKQVCWAAPEMSLSGPSERYVTITKTPTGQTVNMPFCNSL